MIPWDKESKSLPAPGLITGVECQMLRWAGRGVVVEVGSFAGCSTLCLSEKAEVVHAFDRFLVDDINSTDYCPRLGLDLDYRGSFRHVFDRYTKDKKNIVVHEGDALEGDWNEPIDVLFIDASCGETFQLGMVEKFYRHLKVGGLLIHQDFFYYRSPVLPSLMARLWPALKPVANADTSMIYTRTEQPLPEKIEVNIEEQLPKEIEHFGGLKEPGGSVIATQLVYWLLMHGRIKEASRLTTRIIINQRSKTAWDNLRGGWSEFTRLRDKGLLKDEVEAQLGGLI